MYIVARRLPTFSSHGSIRHCSVRDVFSYVVYVRCCLRHSEAEIIIYRFIHKYIQQVCLPRSGSVRGHYRLSTCSLA